VSEFCLSQKGDEPITDVKSLLQTDRVLAHSRADLHAPHSDKPGSDRGPVRLRKVVTGFHKAQDSNLQTFIFMLVDPRIRREYITFTGHFRRSFWAVFHEPPVGAARTDLCGTAVAVYRNRRWTSRFKSCVHTSWCVLDLMRICVSNCCRLAFQQGSLL
jgi:hypothetical protein